jgi:hypothetical protein
MEDEQRTLSRRRSESRLNRKLYNRVQPLADGRLRTLSEATFILTGNCSIHLCPLVSLNERSLPPFPSNERQISKLHGFD